MLVSRAERSLQATIWSSIPSKTEAALPSVFDAKKACFLQVLAKRKLLPVGICLSHGLVSRAERGLHSGHDLELDSFQNRGRAHFQAFLVQKRLVFFKFLRNSMFPAKEAPASSHMLVSRAKPMIAELLKSKESLGFFKTACLL